jgi:hypothetical protein
MENLWQRLKPAVKKQILAEKENYPYLVDEVKVNLEKNSWWNDLPVNTVRHIITFSHSSVLDASLNDFMWGEKFIKKA